MAPASMLANGSASDTMALLKRAEQEGIVGVRTVMMNIAGVVRGHVFPTKRFFGSVYEKGAQMPVSYLTMGPQDLFATGLPPDDSFGCVGTVNWRPDLDSIKPLPYHPTNYWSAADLHTDDGLPWAYCPRSILKRQLSQLKEKYGAEFVIGPEFEFHMFKEYDQGTGRPSMWLTHQAGEILGLRGTPGKVMDTICTTLGAAGIDLNNWHCEGGNIQWEFSLAPYEALKQADNMVYTRIAVKNVADEFGFKATMCPKPLGPNEIGNGGHVHFSLRDPTTGANLLADDSTDNGISDLGKKFMAGVLAHLPGLCGVILPTEMSYARAVSSMWAGVYSCWGRENKEAALRVCCPGGKVSNVELKLADSTSNPYLVIALILAAGLDGIKNNLELPPETLLDPAYASEELKLKNKITAVPSSLDEALEALKADSVLMDALGPEFSKTYLITTKFVADYVKTMPDKERYLMYCEKY